MLQLATTSELAHRASFAASSVCRAKSWQRNILRALEVTKEWGADVAAVITSSADRFRHSCLLQYRVCSPPRRARFEPRSSCSGSWTLSASLGALCASRNLGFTLADDLAAITRSASPTLRSWRVQLCSLPWVSGTTTDTSVLAELPSLPSTSSDMESPLAQVARRTRGTDGARADSRS